MTDTRVSVLKNTECRRYNNNNENEKGLNLKVEGDADQRMQLLSYKATKTD